MAHSSKYRVRPGIAFVAAAFAAVASTLAQAAASPAPSYPERPVRFIVPAAPGGTTDTLARMFGERMTAVFNEQVVVDNRASASGVLAGDLVAHADPDGYTLFLPYHQHTVNAALLSRLPYHPVNDFTPITQLTAAGLMLVVHPSTPAGNMNEFIAWTKNHKGALNFGSAGIGSGGHLAGELYKVMTGAKAQHIPYKGTGPALTALLGGEYRVQLCRNAGGFEHGKGRAIEGHRGHLPATRPVPARYPRLSPNPVCRGSRSSAGMASWHPQSSRGHCSPDCTPCSCKS